MNTAEYVGKLIEEQKSQGVPLQDVVWNAALACVGWAYVFGARWQYCTPANRRARYSDDHPTIKTACKNFNGSSSTGCEGCKWFPKSKYTRINDCRGFTYGILKSVYGWELMGAGCTSQWNNENNWTAKGEINTIPDDILVCLFVKKGKTMEHTGFGYKGETVECSSGVQHFKGETVECSSGVQHFTSRKNKWTHWGLPKCVSGDVPPSPTPTPTPTPDKRPTLRLGSTGVYVVECQNDLIQLGYSVGSTGADGKFGKNTQTGVKAFQKDHPPLVVDGVVGSATWSALDEAIKPTPVPPVEQLYTVTILHLDKTQATAICNAYPNATMKEE